MMAVLMGGGCGASNRAHRTYAPPIQTSSYIVKQGDTLYSIARRAGVDLQDLANRNHIASPYTIYPGQQLSLRPSAPTSNKKIVKKTNRYKKNQKKSKKNLKDVWQWPLKGVIARNFRQTGRKGIDIKGPPGAAVRASAAGKVVYSGNGLVGYGSLVIIKHDEIFLSAYGNNRKLRVKEGQWVGKGHIIAELGRGMRRVPVLHFEIRKKGKPVNPLLYLPRQ